MPNLPKNFLNSLLILLGIGLIVLSSAGVGQSQRLHNQNYYYFEHQLLYGVTFGLFLFYLASKLSLSFWKKNSLFFLLISIGILLLVFLPSFGIFVKGASRWVDFKFFSFQPAEVLKLTMIIYLAAWFSKNIFVKSSSYSIVPFISIFALVALILALQPDIGTLIVIGGIGFVMFLIAGAKLKHIFYLLLLGFILVAILAYSSPYRWNRITTFINPNYDLKGAGYHLNQSLISIGSGGLLGVGYGKSKQKLGLLPEPIGDSIFAVAAEEFGFIGSSVILSVYLFFLVTMVRIAISTKERFNQLFIIGIVSWITIQTIINISAISGLLPLTGIPLPFMSYGSSSLVSLLIGLGIVYRISKTA